MDRRRFLAAIVASSAVSLSGCWSSSSDDTPTSSNHSATQTETLVVPPTETTTVAPTETPTEQPTATSSSPTTDTPTKTPTATPPGTATPTSTPTEGEMSLVISAGEDHEQTAEMVYKAIEWYWTGVLTLEEGAALSLADTTHPGD